MIVGITGTQKGPNISQIDQIGYFMHCNRNLIHNVHHGVCIGVDEWMNEFAHLHGITTWGHPPEDQSKMSNCGCDHMLEPKPYLERNHDIVDVCDVLLVVPYFDREIIRSGTWATYRYAKKAGTPIEMIRRIP